DARAGARTASVWPCGRPANHSGLRAGLAKSWRAHCASYAGPPTPTGEQNQLIGTGTQAMCGICGIYEYKTQKPVDQQVLDDMLQVLHHRGPDDAGWFLDRDLAIGMRRLSIIDLNGGKQPINNEDGTVVTVFN